MRKLRRLSSLVFLAFVSASIQAGEPAESYLVNGKLKARIMVQVVHGGFAGFTGAYYAIEPDGSWTTGRAGPGKPGAPQAKGKLSETQLAELAKCLAQHDLDNLPTYGKPTVNPMVTKIVYGNKVLQLNPRPGEATAEADKAIRARYNGIVQTIKALCKEPKKE